MRFDLNASTDVAHFAIYDPAALPHLLPGTVNVIEELDGEVRAGRVLAYDPVGDGDERVRIYLDEDVPRELARRKEHAVAACLLRVPSGRLVVSGLEDLWTRRPKDMNPQAFKPANGEECRIPPGHYLADAFDIFWRDQLEASLETIKGRADRFVDKFVGPVMGLVVAGSVLGAPVALGVIAAAGMGWQGVWTLLKYLLIVHAVFWPLVWLYFKLPGAWSEEYREKEKEVLKEHPSLVLVLKKLPEEARLDDYTGGRFGPGYEPGENRA